MVLNIRQKQIDALVRLLHLNAPPAALKPGHDDEAYKVLVLDAATKDVVAPLLRVSDLRKHGITLHLMLEADRQAIPDVPAVYFVRGGEDAVDRIVADAAAGLYDALHLNFTPCLTPPLLQRLAAGMVAAACAQRVGKVYDQYLSFIALEAGLFSLGLRDTYLQLNDPAARDTQISAASQAVVEGLLSALITLGIVPIIRCPKGGAAEHIARQLDARLREQLAARQNPFSEAAPALAASLARPLLCLFDRNFELSVMLQHTWTYKPLVHDVLGLALNRVTVEEPASAPAAAAVGLAPQAPAKKHFEVGEGDFFWEANGRNQFPKVAEDVDVQLRQYKQAVEELNRATGAGIDPDGDPGAAGQANTRGLMAAVSSLPELTERKRCIDKHTNLATHLLHIPTTSAQAIKGRGLDQFYNLEEDMLAGKADTAAMLRLIQGDKGTPADKLRLALVQLLTCEALPGEPDFDRATAALAAAGADLAALAYVRRMRRMNLTGRSAAGAAGGGGGGGADGPAGGGGGAAGGALAGLAGQSHLLSWADKTFGQGLSSLTKGVKVLLAGEQQAAVTVAVEALMDGKSSPELDSFATFDPKAAAGRPARAAGPFREALVFMIGGGNYLEYESLATWAGRATPPKSIVYGATDLLTGEQVLAQLAELGRRSGI